MKGGKIKMQYIILLILGIIAIVISFATKNSNNTSPEMIQAYGTITKVIYSDAGNVRYYINIDAGNGQVLESQSIYYTKTNRKYHVDDTVPVNYYYTKDNKIRCEVNDSELVKVKDSFATVSKVTLIAGIIFIALFLILTIKSFI